MDLQVTKGDFTTFKDLVLYLDIQRHTSESSTFMAALYEATKEGTTTGENPIFHGSGAGIQDSQDTLTFIDFLLEFNDLPQVDLEMATWFFQVQDDPAIEPGRYKIRYEILGKVAYIQSPGESKYRVLPAHDEQRSHMVSV